MAMSASVASAVWPVPQKVDLGRLPGGIVIERENFRFYFSSSLAHHQRRSLADPLAAEPVNDHSRRFCARMNAQRPGRAGWRWRGISVGVTMAAE
jgi:Protein of unknown function (DUF2905)